MKKMKFLILALVLLVNTVFAGFAATAKGNIEIEYDAYAIDHSKESPAVKAYPHGNSYVTEDRCYELVPMNGRAGIIYYIHDPKGKLEFDVTVPPSRLAANITDDGKLHVSVEFFARYRFSVGEVEMYNNVVRGSVALVTLTGDRGEQLGYNVISPREYSRGEEDYNAYSVTLKTLKSYDGELALIWRSNSNADPEEDNFYDCPMLYFDFDKENDYLVNVGLCDDKGAFAVPVYQAEFDEEAEVELVSNILKDSDAEELVSSARSERPLSPSKYSPDIMFIPVPDTKPEKNGNTAEEAEETPAPASPAPPSFNYNPDIMFIPVPTPAPEKPQPQQNETVNDGRVRILLNGEELKIDVEPIIVGDRVLVPIRAIFEKLGAVVVWNGAEKNVLILKDANSIEFEINNTSVKVNNSEKQMDVPAQIFSERTLVPLRFLSESLGYGVDWKEETREVLINGK